MQLIEKNAEKGLEHEVVLYDASIHPLLFQNLQLIHLKNRGRRGGSQVSAVCVSSESMVICPIRYN